MKEYLSVCRMLTSDEEWKAEGGRLGVDPAVLREIEEDFEKTRPSVGEKMPEEIDEMLQELTREYHRSTGF